jgi:hypothetical protein
MVTLKSRMQVGEGVAADEDDIGAAGVVWWLAPMPSSHQRAHTRGAAVGHTAHAHRCTRRFAAHRRGRGGRGWRCGRRSPAEPTPGCPLKTVPWSERSQGWEQGTPNLPSPWRVRASQPHPRLAPAAPGQRRLRAPAISSGTMRYPLRVWGLWPGVPSVAGAGRFGGQGCTQRGFEPPPPQGGGAAPPPAVPAREGAPAASSRRVWCDARLATLHERSAVSGSVR